MVLNGEMPPASGSIALPVKIESQLTTQKKEASMFGIHNFLKHSIYVSIAVTLVIVGKGLAEGFYFTPMWRVLLGCLILVILESSFFFASYEYGFSWTPILGLLITFNWGWLGYEILTTHYVFLIVKILWLILFLIPGMILVENALRESHERFDYKLREERESRCSSTGGRWSNGGGGYGDGGWSGNYGGRD